MKRLFVAAFMFLSVLTTNVFAEIKMGVILGFTGPIESLTPAMAGSAELARTCGPSRSTVWCPTSW